MKKLLTCIAMGFATTSYAVPPLWMRDVQISPDGTEIAFCYKGDIYKVPAKGGTATQLTTQASYECTPIWSPDGKQIAFASDRNGNFDLFVMPSNGGTAQCLTTHSASEIPSAFTPDGKYVLFSASIQDPAQSALFPTSAMTELYKVPVGGGRTEQVLGTPAEMVCFDKSGKTFLYQDRKGFEDEWRKHHTSSVTRDIWMYDTQTGKHTNLTDHAGEDRNAVFTPDGQTVYFLSERNGGSFNVYSFPLNTPQSITAVTKFKTHPVRFLSTGSDQTLCYTYDGEIYTQRPGSNPQKVRIDLIRDDQEQIADLNSSKGATSATVSPDGKQIALTLRGEVFVTSADYNTTKQITNTPATDNYARTFSLGDQVFQLITMPFYLHQGRTTEIGAGRNEERRSVRKRVNIHQQLSGSTFQATFDIHGVCIIIHTRSRIVNIYIHVRINAETRHKGKTTSQRQIRRNRSSDLHIYTRQTNTHSCRNRIENP